MVSIRLACMFGQHLTINQHRPATHEYVLLLNIWLRGRWGLMPWLSQMTDRLSIPEMAFVALQHVLPRSPILLTASFHSIYTACYPKMKFSYKERKTGLLSLSHS